MTTIRDWQKAVGEYADEKGWWDRPREVGTVIALMHSELSEALEEVRKGHEIDHTYYNPASPGKPEGVPSELADVVIRVLDACHHWGIDLQAILEEKHKFNLTRPYRHGKAI